MSGPLSHLPHVTGSRGPMELVTSLLKGNGLNIEPGPQDDGWETPTPITLSDGSTVRLYKDGESLKSAYDAVAAAQSRICMEFYIWADDNTGRAFADLLMKKAREGVHVYIIYDSLGTWGTNDRKMFDNMRRSGIRVGEFHPIRPWECKFSWRPYARDHRKILVVDDKYAGVGGLNIADNYAGSWVAKNSLKPNQYWRDTAIGIRGPAHRMFLSAFIRNWNYIHKGGRIIKTQYVGNVNLPKVRRGYHAGTSRVEDLYIAKQPILENEIGLIATSPCLNSPLRPILHTLLNQAKTSIRMTMAYFAPDDDLIESLCRAARRGVKVQLMFGAKSDMPIMITAARAFYERMLSAGVEIFERQHVILHAKTMIIDSEIALIGSTNLDYRSIEYNLEISAVVRSHEFGKQTHALFDNDIQFSRKINLAHWKRRPYWDKFVQSLVRRVRYVL